MAGRHAAPATGAFSLPTALTGSFSTGSRTTGSLTRAGIAAALVTASAAAVAGSTGALTAPADTSNTDAQLMAFGTTPDDAAVPAPRAHSAVAPVSGSPAVPVQTVKHSSPAADQAASDQADAEKADAEKAEADEAGEAESSSEESGASPESSESSGEQQTASAGPLGDRIVDTAAGYEGTPYEYGATGPDSFDCSGFTQQVFSEMGIDLPRTSQQQYDAAQHISKDQAQPGDLVFVGGPDSVHHVAIYAGDDKIWTAPQSGESVKLGNTYGDWSVGRVR